MFLSYFIDLYLSSFDLLGDVWVIGQTFYIKANIWF